MSFYLHPVFSNRETGGVMKKLSSTDHHEAIREIKINILKGHKVYWKNQCYPVVKDRLGQYFIICSTGMCHGLTNALETKLSGEIEDFFIVES